MEKAPVFYDSNFDKYFTPEEAGWYIGYKTESGDSGAVKVNREPLDNADALNMLLEIDSDELWYVTSYGEVRKQKFLIIGHARHGKDSFAEILAEEYDFKFISSSQAASDIFIFDTLKSKYNYTNSVECFEDRVNHRAEWYEMICDYNKDDRARLAKSILNMADCYVGMRDRDEIKECLNQGLFDLIIWVDASERLPEESADSFNIDKSLADIIVENNGTYEEFVNKVKRLGKFIIK